MDARGGVFAEENSGSATPSACSYRDCGAWQRQEAAANRSVHRESDMAAKERVCSASAEQDRVLVEEDSSRRDMDEGAMHDRVLVEDDVGGATEELHSRVPIEGDAGDYTGLERGA